jgi:hypothetical protein
MYLRGTIFAAFDITCEMRLYTCMNFAALYVLEKEIMNQSTKCGVLYMNLETV